MTPTKKLIRRRDELQRKYSAIEREINAIDTTLHKERVELDARSREDDHKAAIAIVEEWIKKSVGKVMFGHHRPEYLYLLKSATFSQPPGLPHTLVVEWDNIQTSFKNGAGGLSDDCARAFETKDTYEIRCTTDLPFVVTSTEYYNNYERFVSVWNMLQGIRKLFTTEPKAVKNSVDILADEYAERHAEAAKKSRRKK